MCTIEKANNIINHLIKTKTLENYRTVIIDEVHMMSDPKRGYMLEILMNKLLFMQCAGHVDLQLIAISATLPNIDDFVKYTNSVKFVGTHRPNHLTEYIIVVFSSLFNTSAEINSSIAVGSCSPPTPHSLLLTSFSPQRQTSCPIATWRWTSATVRPIRTSKSSSSCPPNRAAEKPSRISSTTSTRPFPSSRGFSANRFQRR